MYSGDYRIRRVPNLRGGLNNYDDPTEISDSEISACENIEIDDNIIKTSAGYVMYDEAPAAGPYWGGFQAQFENGTERLIRQRQTTLEYDDGAGNWTACTVPATLTQKQCSFVMLNNIILWSNGQQNVMSSADGITWTARASLPKSEKLFNNGLNRIVFAVQPGAPSRIDWSDINDPLTIGGDSFQFVGKNDGQEIKDLVLTPQGGVLLFKTNRFYAISDVTMDTVGVDPIGEAPCVTHTAVATENSIMWAGQDGRVYEYSGGAAKLVSGNIKALQVGDVQYMTASYFNTKYRLALPNGSDSFNSKEYIFHRKVFTGKESNPYVVTENLRNIGCYVPTTTDTGGLKIYFGDSTATATWAYINDTHNQGVTQGLNGADQHSEFETKFYQEDVEFYIKRYTKLFFQAYASQDTEVTFGYRFDPLDGYTDVVVQLAGTELNWILDSLEEDDFTEGFGFSAPQMTNEYISFESGDEPRGIQIRVKTDTNQDVLFYNLSYKFLAKKQYH